MGKKIIRFLFMIFILSTIIWLLLIERDNHISMKDLNETGKLSIYEEDNLQIENLTLIFNEEVQKKYYTKFSNNNDDNNILPEKGKWDFENKVLRHKEILVEGLASSIVSTNLSNYSVESKIIINDVEITDSQAQIFSFGNSYVYRFAIKLNGWELYKIQNNQYTMLTFGGFSNSKKTWHTLKIIFIEPLIQCYIDDELLCNIEDIDSSQVYRKIGVGTYLSDSSFSDISIKKLSNQTVSLNVSYNLLWSSSIASRFLNISVAPFLVKKRNNPSGFSSYITIYNYSSINYNLKGSNHIMNESFNMTFPIDLIRPPDIIYFPSEIPTPIFAIHLIARGWDEEKQEWVFREFNSPEFTWEDVVEGRTIAAC